VFGSACEAARHFGIEQSAISMCIRGHLRSYKGMLWSRLTREEYAEAVGA
jgi:hypothetical protein